MTDAAIVLDFGSELLSQPFCAPGDCRSASYCRSWLPIRVGECFVERKETLTGASSFTSRCMPTPCALDNGVESGMTRLPTEQLAGVAGICDKSRWIAWPARGLSNLHALLTHALDFGYHFSHRVAFSCAQIKGHAFVSIKQVLERKDMRRRQIRNVNIVADCRPIGCRIIRSIDVQRRPGAASHIHGQRDQMSFRAVHLSDFAFQVRPSRVEVSQRHASQTVSLSVPIQSALQEALGFSVRVNRHLRMILRDRNRGRHSVRRTRRGKNNVLDARIHKNIEEVEGIHDIVLEVLARLAHRLTYVSARREVDDRLNAILGKSGAQQCRVSQVSTNQRAPLYGPGMAGGKIVEYDRLATHLGEQFGRVTTDIACSASHQDSSSQWDCPLVKAPFARFCFRCHE